MIVVDASVVVDLLLGPGGVVGDELAERFRRREVICAPHLLDVDVAQTLRRYSLGGKLPDSQANELMSNLRDLPINRYSDTVLLPRAFELRMHSSVYDGIYLALAEALDRPLLTTDPSLALVEGCRARVEVRVPTGF